MEEYLDGGTLQEILEKNGLFQTEELIELGIPLITAVEHIQSLELVHRELKNLKTSFFAKKTNHLLSLTLAL